MAINAHPDTSETTLMDVLSFTTDDLEANREGKLSQRQRQYLSVDRRKNAMLGAAVVVGLVMATVLMLLYGINQSSRILQALGVMLLFFNFTLTWLFGVNWVRTTYDLRTNRVEIVEGKAQHVIRQFGRAKAGSVRIGDVVEIPTDADTFTIFEPSTTYRLYRTSHSQRLLSVEKL